MLLGGRHFPSSETRLNEVSYIIFVDRASIEIGLVTGDFPGFTGVLWTTSHRRQTFPDGRGSEGRCKDCRTAAMRERVALFSIQCAAENFYPPLWPCPPPPSTPPMLPPRRPDASSSA